MNKQDITISVQEALSYKEAANKLGITTMTLWRWVKTNKIIAVRLGRYKFIPNSEIERIKNAK